jgi:predicted nucleotidyltransferase
MSSTVAQLARRQLIKPPAFLADNVHYECMMGSVAYGVATDTSDVDLYGFCMPPKEVIFPHLAGHIGGFGRQKQRFEQFEAQGVADPDALRGRGKEYDITIYNIVKYFQLCMDNNPNIIDSLFVPEDCVLHITALGQMVREQRKLFLHKGSWHRFKGYAYSQLKKMGAQTRTGKRKEEVEKWGFDLKFAYHVVRLLDEVEQILTLGDIDLRRNREQLKAIRRGDISEQEIRDWAAAKEKALEPVYHSSSLPYKPRETEIKELLLQCLEHHYGNLETVMQLPDKAYSLILQLQQAAIASLDTCDQLFELTDVQDQADGAP